jgi:O-antigen/teichoic acid export membrane protein
MTFRSGVTLTLAARTLAIGVGLLSSIVTARWLGPEGRGVLITLSVLTGLALQFGNLGLHSSSVYFVAREPEKTGAVLGNLLWLSLALGTVAALLMIGACRLKPEWFAGIPLPLVLVSATAVPFQFMILFFQNTLLGMQEVTAFNAFELTNKTLTFLSLFVYLVVFSGGAAGAVVLFAAFGAAFGLASVAYCGRRVPFRLAFDPSLLSRMLHFGTRSYLSCLLSFLVIRSDMLMVNTLLGVAEAGVYSIAVQIADVLLLVPVTIGMVLLPRVAAEAPENREAVTARVTRHAALLLAVLCAAAFLLVGPLVSLLYGPRFEAAVAATRWLLPGIWALGMNGILMNHFGGQGMPPVTILAPLVGAVLNIALNAAVVPRYGIVGAAVTSTLAYSVMLTLSLAVFLRGSRVRLRESLILAPEEVYGLLGLRT